MIPLRDVIPSRTTPVVTITLIAASSVVFLYQLALGANADALILAWGLVPEGFSWLTVLTSLFLHDGLLHFGADMLYLWMFGENVEDRMGHGRFAIFYLLCGTAAALAQTGTDPASPIPIVGASGAITGVMGAYFFLYPHSRILTLVPTLTPLIEVPAVVFLALWFAIHAVSGVMHLWAHVAGFGVGMATVALFRRPERQLVEWWSRDPYRDR